MPETLALKDKVTYVHFSLSTEANPETKIPVQGFIWEVKANTRSGVEK